MTAACRTDLCRQGRSPCPTPSACVGLVQVQGRFEQVNTCASHQSGPTEGCPQPMGLFSLHDTPIGATTNDGDVHHEFRCLRWLVPVTVALSVVAAAIQPWGFA